MAALQRVSKAWVDLNAYWLRARSAEVGITSRALRFEYD